MVSDEQIAVMCDVARSAGSDLAPDKQHVLSDLMTQGYVALAHATDAARPRYRLTPAGQALLDERGVGANES